MPFFGVLWTGLCAMRVCHLYVALGHKGLLVCCYCEKRQRFHMRLL